MSSCGFRSAQLELRDLADALSLLKGRIASVQKEAEAAKSERVCLLAVRVISVLTLSVCSQDAGRSDVDRLDAIIAELSV